MEIGLQLSLELGTFGGKDLIDLFERFVKFEPYLFIRDTKTAEWNAQRHRKVMEKYACDVFLGLSDKSGNTFSAGPTNVPHSFLSFRVVQHADYFFPATDELNQVLDSLPGLISSYLYYDEYVDVQSEIFETNYIRRQLPKDVLDSVRNTPFKMGVHGREFDVRVNPGRKILIDRSYLLASWKMWLAEPFFVLVPKERILAFPYAVEIKELPSGIVYVQLFERLEESHTPDSMFRQWKWQEWLDFDSLIKNHDS